MELSLGRWHTDGHVERGDDLQSYSPMGLKNFLIAKKGKYWQLLLKNTEMTKGRVNLILNDPPKGWNDNVKIFVSASDLFVVQRILCGYSGLTISEGPAYVTYWEAMGSGDAKHSQQTMNYFAPGNISSGTKAWAMNETF